MQKVAKCFFKQLQGKDIPKTIQKQLKKQKTMKNNL